MLRDCKFPGDVIFILNGNRLLFRSLQIIYLPVMLLAMHVVDEGGEDVPGSST